MCTQLFPEPDPTPLNLHDKRDGIALAFITPLRHYSAIAPAVLGKALPDFYVPLGYLLDPGVLHLFTCKVGNVTRILALPSSGSTIAKAVCDNATSWG